MAITKLPVLAQNLKADLLKVEAYLKTIGTGILGGAAGATYRLFQNLDHEALLFTHDGLVKLKNTAICGAALTVLGYFLPSPLKQTLGIHETTAGRTLNSDQP